MTARVLTEDQKQRARERARAWHWANRDKAIATSRNWAAANREAARKRTLEWREANRERARENDRRKRANRSPEYLEKRRIDEQNRRARIKANGGRLTKGLGARLFAEQRGRCRYCAADLSAGYHLDHIMPLLLGGKNEDANIQVLCPPCNRRKHAKHPDEFPPCKR